MARWLHYLAAFLASASSIQAEQAEKKIDSCQLDPVLVPFQYELKIDPDYPSRRFKGEVIITGRVQSSTDLLLLDSGVNVTRAELIGSTDVLSTAKITDENDLLELEFNHMLEPDKDYRLFLEFTGEIRSSRGIFGDNYTTPDGQQSYFIATEMQPNYASQAFPCVDRPAYKAHFLLNVSRPHHLVALSNMPRLSSRQDEEIEGKVWDSFEKSPLMSTYTFAFVIADLVPCLPEPGDSHHSDTFNNTVWLLRGHQSLGWFAAKWSPIYLEQLEDYTGIKYGLPKMDHVALPYLASTAMENWGLITYKQEVVEMEATSHTVRSEFGLIWILAHEIIHQWFGNLVTCSSWAYTWLNEGVTSFLHFHLSAKVFGEWDMLGLMMSEEVLKVMDDEGFSPVSLTKENCTMEASDTFSMASYYKGAALMRMVYFMLGDDGVKQALRNYLKANEYGCVAQEDLWIHFDEEARKDPAILPENTTMGEIMNTWTNNQGFPYVTVAREEDHILLRQARMSFFQPDDLPVQSWWIPLSYTTSSERNLTFLKPRLWMKPDDTVTRLDIKLDKHDWIIFNLEQSGYYRTLYDNDSWSALTRQLQVDHKVIPPLTRAKLLDDVFSLAFFKKLHYSTPLALSKYLAHETHYYPWSSAIRALEQIHFYLKSTDVNQKFEMFLLKLVEKAYESLSNNNDYNDSYRDTNSRLLHGKILHFACSLGHKACEKRALDLMQRLLNNDTHYIRKHLDEVHPLMCTMVRLGSQEIWDLAFDMYKAEKIYKPKEELMEALKCTTDKAVWQRLIRNYLNGEEDYMSVDLFSTSIYDKESYCYIIEEIEKMLQQSTERLADIWAVLLDLSGAPMPEKCRKKLKEVVESSVDMEEEEAEILTSLEKSDKPWIRLKEIEDWFDVESNMIDMASDGIRLNNEENYLKKPRSPFDGMDDTFDMYHYPRSPYDYDYDSKADGQGKRKSKAKGASSSSSAAADFNLFVLILSVLPSPIYLTYILFAPIM